MQNYEFYNPNPAHKRVGDCTVRAISKALDQSWETTFLGIVLQSLIMFDMPSANAVWGAYLKNKGFTRQIIPDTCPDCYTVSDFAADHPRGTYILALSKHVVCVQDGILYDSWDSREEVPLYYWERSRK